MKTKLIALLLLFIPIVARAEPSSTPAPQDKLQVALADMVSKSVQVAGDAKDFLVAQLPDVIRQLLAWKMVEAAAWAVGFGAASLLIFRGLVKWRKYIFDEDFDAIIWLPFSLVSIFDLVIAVAALQYFTTVLQIWIAPKVFLIEYSKNLITGH